MEKTKMKEPKIFLVLKILAPIMLILGIILIVFGTAIFPEMITRDLVVPNSAFSIPGIIIVFLSIPCFFIAYMPNINKTMIKTTKYIQEDNKEDLNDIANNSADIMSGAVTKTTKAIKKGLNDSKYCRFCGEKIESDSQYCKFCGKKQDL